MSCSLLPEWLDLILDNVETTLCLPMLIIMVLCTAQFIVNHAMDIGYTVYQNIKQKSDEGEGCDCPKEKGEDLITKIKGLLANWGIGQSQTESDDMLAAHPLRRNSQEEEWDYCEEDDD
ncbi:uncharacterized protein LOC143354679 isoform X1 [Halictus rubicundus]|uniref:uncharacterized protein LOC143354679 isoform X1 n=1 Tax=Halictus rubicundus TaxID=77578 RepID=UPI0040364F73